MKRCTGSGPLKVLGELAHHYARAEDAAKAVQYLTQLGDKAAAAYALVEAVTAYQEALVHAERLTPDEGREPTGLGLVVNVGLRLVLLGRFAEPRDLFIRYGGRLDQLDDPALAGPYHVVLSVAYDHLGNLQLAASTGERALAEAGRANDARTAGKARSVLAMSCFWAGQLVEPRPSCSRAVCPKRGRAPSVGARRASRHRLVGGMPDRGVFRDARMAALTGAARAPRFQAASLGAG